MDVKETKEIIEALGELIKELRVLAKDGVDWSDGIALVTKLVKEDEFRQKLVVGIQGADKIIAELKDLDGAEAVQLIQAIVDEYKKQA